MPLRALENLSRSAPAFVARGLASGSPRPALLATAMLGGLLGGGCVLPYAVPPSRFDFGATHIVTGEDRTAFHFAAGVHTASLGAAAIPNSDAIDIGVGYVLDRDHHGLRDQGFYADGSWFFFRRTHVRFSGGLRGSFLFSGDRTGSDLVGRVSAEVFKAGSGTGSSHGNEGGCSDTGFVWHGVPGTALFVESGAQHLPDGRAAFVATAGLSLRLPAIAGLVFVMPGCS